ncbi:MAG TPA: tetratricopeptide repeat protein [Acidimicrobiia bacterium]|nr:tetratricopeptide repeat protein [Acidimicrobiia bacterium]
MSTVDSKDRLAAAVALREAGDLTEAKDLLVQIHRENPDDPEVNLQCAWAHDRLGLESEAVPYYEAAIRLGLEDSDRKDALLGLGSTYRTLGRYEEALSTLDRGVAEFPDHGGMSVFRAMALFNNGREKEACELLLTLLASTTSDETIAAYRRAIEIYAADLDRTWS